MTHKRNGGPAFPLPCDDHRDFNAVFESGYGGISVRDYFAAKAMQGLLANPGGPIQANGMSGWSWCNCTAEDVSDLAWHIADAMLKAREVGEMSVHKELAIQALERERFCLSRARAAFKYFSPEEMRCEYGQSGKTRQQILNEYIERDAAILAAIEWVRRQDQ